MSALTILNALLLAAEVAMVSLLVPAAGWLLAGAYRKSAAGRRLVWVMVFSMLLALPLLAVILPGHAVIALSAPPAPDPSFAPPPMVVAAPEPGGLSWTSLIPLAGAVWLAGLLKIGVQHLIALVRLELMRRGAAPWKGPRPVPVRGCQLLVSEECPGPMTWGVFRPVIMLPDEAMDWPEARLEAALRHELAHVQRRDGLVQALSMTACALYWPNPLVWLAARTLRREAELAADDTVIAAGVRPSDYASQLLELAAEWRERRLTPTGLAMAAPPALSRRVQSILSTDANRSGATAMDTFKLVLLGGAATAAFALARPSVAEVPAPASNPAPQAQNVQLTPAPQPQLELSAAPQAKAAPVHDQLAQNTQDKPASGPTFIPRTPASVPYDAKTDDPASPGYIAPGQPGAQHPVPERLAKLLNARKAAGGVPGTNQPWNLTWIPADGAPPAPVATGAQPFQLTWVPNPNGPQPAAPPVVGAVPLRPLPPAPGAVTIVGDSTGAGAVSVNGAVYNFRGITAEQRAELDRKLAAIGPAINKAITDAHVDEAVQKALASQDPKIREAVAKQLADLGPRIQSAVTAAHMQEDMQQRLAEIPQYQEAMKKIRARQADAEDQAAARLEEQAKRARERAKRDRESLTAPQPAPPKN